MNNAPTERDAVDSAIRNEKIKLLDSEIVRLNRDIQRLENYLRDSWSKMSYEDWVYQWTQLGDRKRQIWGTMRRYFDLSGHEWSDIPF